MKKTTTLRLSTSLTLAVEQMGLKLGMRKGEMVTMSMAMMLVRLTPLFSSPRKRRALIKEVEKEFQKLVKEAEERCA